MTVSECIGLGSTPACEECIQVSLDSDYMPAMSKECWRYVEMLQNRFPQYEKFDCHFRAKTGRHDFGEYKEVVIAYDDQNERSSKFAFYVEEMLPERWEDDSILIYQEESCAPLIEKGK